MRILFGIKMTNRESNWVFLAGNAFFSVNWMSWEVLCCTVLISPVKAPVAMVPLMNLSSFTEPCTVAIRSEGR